MRSTFSRQLITTLCMVLLCLGLVGTAFTSLLFRYLVESKQSTLSREAVAVADLAAAYGTSGEMGSDWDLRMSVSFATAATGVDLVICDETGSVVVCSSQNETACDHIGKCVDPAFLTQVQQAGTYYMSGYLLGLYENQRYVAAVPIVSQESSQNLGIVISSSPFNETNQLLHQLSGSFIFVLLFVLLLALLVCTIVARSMSRPVKSLTTTIRRFGHGEMEARATLSPYSTDEMLALCEAFNNMADSLAAAEASRSEFVANVSHELKTPMTTIAGYMDGMLDGTIPPERHRHYMQIVSDEVRRLSRLVRSMLDISRLQAQGIPDAQKQRFDICENVGRVLIGFEQKITDKNLQVEATLPDEPLFVLASPDPITQVVYNLLDNAVKFCPQDGTLRVTVWQEGGKVRIAIANTGPTIPPEELPYVFDRFHKADKSRSEDRDGWGLGLYIARTIVQSHGEDIRVSSCDGLTEFVFTLQPTK